MLAVDELLPEVMNETGEDALRKFWDEALQPSKHHFVPELFVKAADDL